MENTNCSFTNPPFWFCRVLFVTTGSVSPWLKRSRASSLMEPALRGSELYLSPLQTNVYTLSLSRICVYIYIYIYTNLFIYNNNKIIIIMILTIIHTYMRLLDNKADNRSSPSTHSMSGRRRTIPRTAVDFPVPGCKHILHNILVYYIILVHINSYYIISYYIILYHIAHQKSTPHNSS